MIGFYGMGGGLGHLTRIQTFIQNQQIGEPYKVITANTKADLFFTSEQIIRIEADESTTRDQLRNLIAEACERYTFDELYIDVFSGGILGELEKETIHYQKCHYLARRMNWEAYQSLASVPFRFTNTYYFEELTSSHRQFVSTHSEQVHSLQLQYSAPAPLHHEALQSKDPLWLIVHSTHLEELEILIDHAKDIARIHQIKPQFVVLTDLDLEQTEEMYVLQNQRAVDWFPYADKIFSAAGFNTWHQLSDWREKHVCIPFPRKYDDQFWRSSLMKIL